MLLSEIQEALPLLLQLLLIVAVGALLVSFILGIIKFVIKNAIVIVFVLVACFALQQGVFT